MPAGQKINGRTKRRLYEHTAAAVYGEPWLMAPEKIEQICAVLDRRRQGVELSEADLDSLIRRPVDDRTVIFFDDDEPEEDPKGYRMAAGGVAVIPVHGMITQRANMFTRWSGGTSAEDLIAAFDRAQVDSEVKGLVFDFDSPGGQVNGTPDAANRIFSARGGKPMVAVVNTMAASGAYWLASAVGRIVTSPSGFTGSIGVYVAHTEWTQFDNQRGVRTTLVSAGPHKVDANPYEPLGAQGRATLQERVNVIYEHFLSAVAKHRGTTVEAVRSGYGRGKTLYGETAVAAGLADAVGTLDQVVRDLARQVSASSGSGNTTVRIDATVKDALAPATSPAPTKEDVMNPKLKAAAFAAGLIKSLDVSDEVAQASIDGFFAARGEEQPKDVAAAIAAVGSRFAGSSAKPDQVKDGTPSETKTAGEGAPSTRPEAKIRAEERQRIADIEARAEILGLVEKLGATEAEALIEKATDDVWSADKFVAEAMKLLEPKHNPVQGKTDPGNGIKAGSAEADVIFAGALDGLLARCGVELKDKEGKPRRPHEHARVFTRMRLPDIAAASLRARGLRTEMMDAHDIATKFLAQAGFELTPFGSTSYNTPGMYPNLLSALAGKMMDAAMEDPEATFRQWAAQKPSVSDFKPHTIHRLGAFGELPRVPDGDDFPQSTTSEETSWISTDAYGDEWYMTPKMIADDDLDAFTDAARDKQVAHDLTLNRLCVEILTSNPDLPDGTALFHANHGNLGTAGAISTTTLAEGRKLMRLQTHVGAKRRVRIGPALILVPAEIETKAEEIIAPLQMVPTKNDDVNVFRGKLQIITETMLSDASATAWYLFARKDRVRAIVFMFQNGFEQGKKTTYYNPKNNCQIFKIEGRFGAAAGNHRGVFKNAGA
jgi:capsid assembly protease